MHKIPYATTFVQ
jgi:hypothetical protein